MAQVKGGFKELNAPGKVAKARQVVTNMTGNPNYLTPDPTLAAVTAVANALEIAYNASRQGGTALTLALHQAEAAFDDILELLLAYVQFASKGEEAKILSAGLEVRRKSTPVGEMPTPENLHATFGDMDGEVDLTWDPVTGRRSYVAQTHADPLSADGWKTVANPTASRLSVTGLVSGTRYWFRVAAVGTAGQGPWSDPVAKIAP